VSAEAFARLPKNYENHLKSPLYPLRSFFVYSSQIDSILKSFALIPEPLIASMIEALFSLASIDVSRLSFRFVFQLSDKEERLDRSAVALDARFAETGNYRR